MLSGQLSTIKSRSSKYLVKNTLKRFFDIVISIVFLIPFTFLVLPICAIFIKLSSPGSVFFVQKRSGMHHKIFHCYKLRTMKLNKQAEYKQATKNDKRITKIGYFLRITHIDELPQLYNVLIGDMSIIGPRPHMLYHTKIYSKHIPYYDLRLKTKPGLTGLAQIKGYVGEITHETDLKKRVLNDIYYVKKSSLKLNLFILFMTLKQFFGKLLPFKKRKAIWR
ncbi:MAG: sugar transferase [Candidatus Paceibacterota bacterium]